METKEQEQYIADCRKWEKTLDDLFYNGDPDGPCICGIAEIVVDAINAEREKHDKAVESLQKIAGFMSESSRDFDDCELAINTKEICILEIIKRTYGELPEVTK